LLCDACLQHEILYVMLNSLLSVKSVTLLLLWSWRGV
jgi:hypothetical protein